MSEKSQAWDGWPEWASLPVEYQLDSEVLDYVRRGDGGDVSVAELIRFVEGVCPDCGAVETLKYWLKVYREQR